VAKTSYRPIVCAWGAYAGSAGFDAAAILRGNGAALVCFGKTGGGAPRHPLYLRGDRALEPYN
jgi:hypothetical protein